MKIMLVAIAIVSSTSAVNAQTPSNANGTGNASQMNGHQMGSSKGAQGQGGQMQRNAQGGSGNASKMNGNNSDANNSGAGARTMPNGTTHQ